MKNNWKIILKSRVYLVDFKKKSNNWLQITGMCFVRKNFSAYLHILIPDQHR